MRNVLHKYADRNDLGDIVPPPWRICARNPNPYRICEALGTLVPMTLRGVSAFSRDFSAALGSVMDQFGVTQTALAVRLDRSEGFVSQRVGKSKEPRPVDTDFLDAIAEMAGLDTSAVVIEVIRRMAAAGDPSARRVMRREDGKTPAERYAAGYRSVDKPEESDPGDTETA